MAELKVNFEQGNGLVYAHAVDFLGCFARAESKSEAIEGILRDAKEFSEWLLTKEIGIALREKARDIQKGINDLRVIEEVNDIPELGESGGGVALFKTDLEPLSEEMFESCLNIMKLLHEDLLRMAFKLSKEARDLELIPGKRSINQNLTHICNAEQFYISRLGIDVEQQFLEEINMTEDELDSLPILERLVKVRDGVITILRMYYPKMADKVFRNADHTKYSDELWTFTKIIRRFIEHEREHIDIIKLLEKELEKKKAEEMTGKEGASK